MSDFIVALNGVVRDPLVIAFTLLVVGVLAARLLFRARPGLRAITRFVLFVLLTVALLNGGIAPYKPMHSLGGPPIHNVVGVILQIAWWSWAAWILVGILRSVLVFERRPREGKLLQDILAGIIYLAAVFAIIAYVFGLPVQGLLATSGAIAIILGLALQSSLGDVFSGMVLSFSRPYQVDDWIKLGDDTEGRVIELNWRATHILTPQRDLAIVPNSMIAKSKIVNVSSPSNIHGVSVSVRLDSRTAPSVAIGILQQAMLNSRRVLALPEPGVTVKSLDAAAVEYDLTFFVDDLKSMTVTQNELFDLIHRHLALADIALVSPQVQSSAVPTQAAAGEPKNEADRLLAQDTIFASLTRDERSALSTKLKREKFDRDDILLKPGVVLQSLFLIGAGVLSISRRDDGADVELLRLGPGDHFGEIGLLTGTPSTVTMTALTPATIYELLKADLAPILAARPQVAEELSHALARRQAAGRTMATSELGKSESTRHLSDWFSDRIHRLFDLRRG